MNLRMLSFWALVGLGNMQPVLLRDAALARKSLRSFPTIFQWMQNTVEAMDPRAPADSHQQTTGLICAALAALFSNTVLAKDAIADRSVLRFVTRLWLQEDMTQKGQVSGTPYGSLVFSLVLGIAISEFGFDETDNIVLEGAKGNIEKVTDKVLVRLHALIKRTPTSSELTEEVAIYVSIVSGLATDLGVATRPLAKAILQKLKIGDICRLLCALSSFDMPSEGSDSPTVVTARICFSIVYVYLTHQAGIKGVIEVIRGGFLSAILSWSPAYARFPPETNSFIKAVISVHLPRSLVFPSTIEAASDAFGVINKTLDGKAASCIFNEDWSNFKNILLERLVFKSHFDFDKSINGITASCSNVSS